MRRQKLRIIIISEERYLQTVKGEPIQALARGEMLTRRPSIRLLYLFVHALLMTAILDREGT